MNVGEALVIQRQLCDLYEEWILADTTNEALVKKEALFNKFVNGGELAMHTLADYIRMGEHIPPLGEEE